VIELARMAKAIERHYGRPMDIEWAVDKDLPAGGNIFVLQARPETVWSAKPAAEARPAAKSALDHILSGMLQGKRVT
jgi:pyruvate,water dikinase